MNPRTVRWQGGVSFILLLLTAFIAAPLAVFWLAVPALIWALAFNAGYAYSLGSHGRPQRRIEGDRWVARYIGFGLLGPLLVAAVLWSVGFNQEVRIWDFTVNETSSFLIAAAALFTLIICSSVVDWYYIRPRIDGVVCAPPCRSSGSQTWKGPTRWWYLHRGLATLSYMVFVLVLALVIMLMLVREHPAAAGVIGGVGGLAGLLLIFAGNYRAQLPTVAQFVLSPAYCLGDDLAYEAGKWSGRGFVLHVAVPVTKLVPLDWQGLPAGPPFVERKNSDLNEADLTARPTVACQGGCARLNSECVFNISREDRRRRWLIL